MSLDLRRVSQVKRRIAPQIHLHGLVEVLKQFPRDGYVKEIDLTDPSLAQ
jgi:hypothetical protein